MQRKFYVWSWVPPHSGSTKVSQGATGSAASAVLEMKARVKATRVNMMIWSWGTFLWLWVQLPFAIFSLVAFGMFGVIEKLKDTFLGGLASNVIDLLGNQLPFVVARFVADELMTAFDIDLSLYSVNFFESFFLITLVFIIVSFGVLQLFTIYFVYKIAQLEPLWGKGSGFKFVMLILAFTGYCIPLFNLFPWYMVWTGAVWLKPK
jgi:hypothetical protein